MALGHHQNAVYYYFALDHQVNPAGGTSPRIACGILLVLDMHKINAGGTSSFEQVGDLLTFYNFHALLTLWRGQEV